MKKKIMTLVLASLLFAGCGSTAANTKSDAGEQQTAGVSTASESASESDTEDEAVSESSAEEKNEPETISSAASSVSTSTEALQAEESTSESNTEGTEEKGADGLKAILADIESSVQPGTAGASLKTAKAAAALMDFCYTTELTEQELTDAAEAYDEAADDPELLLEQMDSVERMVQSFKDGTGEGALEDSGAESSYPWDDAAYQKEAAVQAPFRIK
ncbi:MAG: hypothetical protein U0L49_07125 [Eubacterium sp.]|nr:hypothetical protein [Eubacterium sp.]